MKLRTRDCIGIVATIGSLFGCSSSDNNAATDAGVVVQEAAGPAKPAADAVTVDMGPQSDPDIAYTVKLKMDPFTVLPGQEIYMCQSYANPFQGQQVDIKTYDLVMATGSHHMFLFYQANATDGAVVKCPQGGISFAPFTFGSQSPMYTQTFPAGVGATIPTTTGFYMNVHYFNTGSETIQGGVEVTMSITKPGIITQHAGVIFLNNSAITVPPTNQPSTMTKTFTLQQDVNLLTAVSHMHKRATNFVSTTSTGQMLFQTTEWADPAPTIFTPPLALTKGTSITWSCTYVNDTPDTLVFGESAATNVMCIGANLFYPVSNINTPVLGSLL